MVSLSVSNLSIEEQAKKFIDEAHKRNIRVIVDVPACASYDLYLQKPDLFVTSSNGEPVVPADWTDVRLLATGTEDKIAYKVLMAIAILGCKSNPIILNMFNDIELEQLDLILNKLEGHDKKFDAIEDRIDRYEYNMSNDIYFKVKLSIYKSINGFNFNIDLESIKNPADNL